MLVIGAGFGRTGTDSMHMALECLGFGPCHHMRSLTADPAHRALWRDVPKGGDPDWRVLLDGYGSCVDWPTAQYWPQLIAAFPDVKVLLTWRSAESWWRSYQRTILRAIDDGPDQETFGKLVIRDQVFLGSHADAMHAMSVYRANVEAVL